MTIIGQNSSTHRRPIPHLRWWICSLLFASTIINYIDRQTFSVLGPFFKKDFHWTNTDYAALWIAFRAAYTIGQTLCERLMDRVGTRRGLSLTVLWYSIVSVLTPLARGFYGFGVFRFLLGAGESGNWPGATKAVSEWFPSANAVWQRLCSTVDLPSVVSLLPSSFCLSISAGDAALPL